MDRNEIEKFAKIGTWKLDVINQKIEWSKGVYNILETNSEKFGLNIEKAMSVIHPEDIERVVKHYNDVIKNDIDYNVEKRLITVNGKCKYIRSTAKKIKNNKGEIIKLEGIFHDISEVKQNEIDLNKTKDEFRNILDSSNDIICTINKDGEFVKVNLATIKILGFHPDEMTGKPFINFVHKDDVEKTNIIAAKILEGLDVTTFENRYIKKDGNNVTLVWSVTWNSKDELMYCVARDATEKLLIEKELRLKENLLNESQELAELGSWNFDFRTDKLTWTDSLYKVFDVDKKTFKESHSSFINFIDEKDKEFVLKTSKKTQTTGEPFNIEYQITTSSGEKRIIEEYGYSEKDENGKVIRLFGTAQNITKRKKREQKLKLMESVVENTNDAILITEAEPIENNGPKILYVNKAFTKLTGYSEEEVIGKTPRILQGPKSDKAELKKLKDALKKWEACEITTINYKKNGEEFWVNFSVNPVTDKTGFNTHWIAIERDVTEQKNKEIERQFISDISEIFNTEEKLENCLVKLCEHINKFGDFSLTEVWLPNADNTFINLVAKHAADTTGEKNFNNTKLITNFKYGEGIPGTTWEKKVHSVHKKNDLHKILKRTKTAVYNEIESVISIPLIINNKVYGVLISGMMKEENHLSRNTKIIKKIETFVGAEIKRKKIENELSQIFNFSPDILCNIDLEGYFKKINPAANKILGYTNEELYKMSIFDLVHPDDKLKLRKEIDSIKSNQETYYFENRFINKNSKTIWLSWTTKTIIEQGIFQCVVKDITDKKELEFLIERTTEMAKIGSWEANFNAQKQEALYWSPMTRKIIGVDENYNPSITNGFEFYDEESKAKILEAGTKLFEKGEKFDIELMLTNKKGKKKWIRTIGQAEFLNGECVKMYGSFQDINERKIAEEKLRITLEEKNNILESIGDGFLTVDKNWKITYWNKQAEQITKKNRDEVLNKNIWEIFSDANDSDFLKYFHQSFSERINTSFVEFSPMLNSWIEKNIYPSKTGLSIYFKDVSERKIAEQKIKETNERYEIVTKATNDAVWDLDLKTNLIIWGKGYNSLFGYNEINSEKPINTWTDHIHPSDRKRVLQSFKEAIEKDDSDDWKCEYRFLKKDSQYAYIVDRAIIIRNEKGDAIRIVGAMTDITYRKEYEESLTKLNTSLERYTKELEISNAELEQFAFVASHDLQEPLRMVTSFLSLLERKYGDKLDEKAREYINFATGGASRMKKIILDLLEFSRAGKPDVEKESVSLESVIKDYKILRKRIIEAKSVTIKHNNLPVIKSYNILINQIFYNLLDNAIKYSKPNENPKIDIEVTDEKTHWKIAIKDQGIGINKEYFDKVFVIFQRLHNRDEFSGTGIGLAIVKKNIESLNGKIWINSEIGKGSTFYFSLPK